MTAAEVLHARGEAEGVARGRAEGKAEGKAELVLRLLRLKFGGVPEVARERILSATSDELDVFADRIITVSNLDEMLVGRGA